MEVKWVLQYGRRSATPAENQKIMIAKEYTLEWSVIREDVAHET